MAGGVAGQAAAVRSTGRWSACSPRITASSPAAYRPIPQSVTRADAGRISRPAARRSTRSAPPSSSASRRSTSRSTMPTGDITSEPAMDEKACVATMAFGMEAIAGGIDLLGLGEMGIGNTTIAAAIYAALYGGDHGRLRVGRGTGLDDAGMARKAAAVEVALATHAGHLGRPAGSAAPPRRPRNRGDGRRDPRRAPAARARGARRLCGHRRGRRAPRARSLARSTTASPGMSRPKARIARCSNGSDKKPLLDLGMRLGEGTGAALAMGLVKAAAACHRDMATFSTAGVSNR